MEAEISSETLGNCIICTEKLSSLDKPLICCKQIIHYSCLEKHFKPECPLCRHPLNISVKGTKPIGALLSIQASPERLEIYPTRLFLEDSKSENKEDPEGILDFLHKEEDIIDDYENNRTFIQEEDSDYDEENNVFDYGDSEGEEEF